MTIVAPLPEASPEASSTWTPPHPTDITQTLSRIGRGRADPTLQRGPDGAIWRTTLMESGPATLRFTQRDRESITAHAWGEGAREALDSAPAMLGAHDDPSDFVPEHPLLHDAHRRHPALRIPRTGRVMEALIPAILEQKVITLQATASWRWLVRAYGSVAPGPAPAGMLVVPSPRQWKLIPSWQWHKAGVDPQRSRTIMACLGVARQLQGAAELPPEEARARLQVIPGVGVWTSAEVAQRAFGDADALSVGDYHLAGYVGHALFGTPFTDDEMVEAMRPWSGHRYRVVRLLQAAGVPGKPKRGPRMAFVDHRWH